ncbi:serine protease [Legionella longbeachae]|uniref:serine protease n=1 Tax=Legionella longbeachae TaxID=450 RepID=UPI0001BEBB41|nr:serine protease [Legionella longbeachae]EEZ95924.1 hypothetical protein LLB_1107 [Legionella longbeachae D-4968]QIN31437.1 hypothetical protein GCB94_04425 [Legionella longbeachae]
MHGTNQIIIRQILDAIRSTISPIFVINSSNSQRTVINGTIFFINHDENTYALTANHVHTDLNIFQQDSINRNIRIRDGGLFADLNPVIAYTDSDNDLVIYRINNTLPHNIRPFRGRLLPVVGDISVGTTLVTMGFPGRARDEGDDHVVFGIYSSFPIVDDITQAGMININIDQSQLELIDGMEIPTPNLDLGGMSGAPIFFIRQGLIETWELCGIVTRSIFNNSNFGGVVIRSDLLDSFS